MNLEEKHAVVLSTIESGFTQLEERGEPPTIDKASQWIAKNTGLLPAEVDIILRELHRAGKIGYLCGALTGHVVWIARDQSLLETRRVVTSNERRRSPKALPRERRKRTTGPVQDAPEVSAELSGEEALHQQIAELKGTIASLQNELRGKNRAERKLDAAIERATGLQASLNEAKRTIRSLTDAIELLQPEADRVPELERRVADLTARETVSGELAETIAKLTSTD